jgi:hypothetical protein
MKTQLGKKAALKALAVRRAHYKTVTLPRNEDLPAGAPMYFRCLGCGATMVEPEGWITRNSLCTECAALKELGWLE